MKRFLRSGFTLVELLAALVVVLLLATLVLSLTGRVFGLWRETTDAIGEWQAARSGFEAMCRRLSQATLNTTWAYFDGPGGSGNLTTTDPVSYGRYSELHFVSGPAAELLPEVAGAETQGIFFQAPLGRTRHTDFQGMTHLLNVCGFFVQFGDDAVLRPDVAIFRNIPSKSRFRLMELVEPSENFGTYSATGVLNFDWFRRPVEMGLARPLAENVVALFLLPRLSALDTASASALAPHFSYNSRQSRSYDAGSTKGNTLHQLPPLLQVVMVAIDERSAERLTRESGGTPPDFIFQGAAFSDASQFEQDLARLARNLTDAGVKYRIFSSIIGVRGAKWSSDRT